MESIPARRSNVLWRRTPSDRRRPARWRAVCAYALGLCVALTGCTSVIDGTPKAANRGRATNGPVFPSQLVDLLTKSSSVSDGIVRIPVEESNHAKRLIDEYLDAYHGEGIQQIACFS